MTLNLKIAKVVPVHKSGNNSGFSNYCPISFLRSILKVMDKNVYEQVEKYLATK